MTPDDFKALISILSTADGGCSYCFKRLVEQCYKKFPDWPWDLLPETEDWNHEFLSALLADLKANRRPS